MLEYLESLEALPDSMVTLLEPEGISAVVKKRLKAMMAACDPGRGTGKQDAAAAHMHVLLGMLRLAMCSSAAHDAAELVVDLYPVVGRTLGVELPAIDEGDKGDTDEDVEGEGNAGVAGQGTGWVNQLTECLLSLLSDSLGSVPMAVMRVASEGVWRAAAPHVNAVALSDLLQVLLRLDQKAVAEEAMFEEEDEDEEEEEEDDDEEDEEDEEESEEEVDEADAAKGGQGELGGNVGSAQAKVGGAGEESEEEEEGSEGEGLTDAAMFRLDKQLGKYFAKLKGGKEVRLAPPLHMFGCTLYKHPLAACCESADHLLGALWRCVLEAAARAVWP